MTQGVGRETDCDISYMMQVKVVCFYSNIIIEQYSIVHLEELTTCGLCTYVHEWGGSSVELQIPSSKYVI